MEYICSYFIMGYGWTRKRLAALWRNIISSAPGKPIQQYEKYFEQHKTPVRGLRITPKQEAIDNALNSGYFVLLSNEIKDPIDALRTYRSRDVIEKAFGNLKERLNMRRESVASEENLEGKLFIQFVVLIYLSYIKKAMDENDLYINCCLSN